MGDFTTAGEVESVTAHEVINKSINWYLMARTIQQEALHIPLGDSGRAQITAIRYAQSIQEDRAPMRRLALCGH